VLLRAGADRQVISADGGDLGYVTLTLADRAGTCCTHADRPVRAEVSGQGLLLGFGSARPSTEERFDVTEHRTYDGRALAVLRPTGPGTIRLTATAPGCEPAEILITVT
jgi:beta-galactosidase